MANPYFQISFRDGTVINEEAYRVISARPKVSQPIGRFVGGAKFVTQYSDPVWTFRVGIGPLERAESAKLRDQVGDPITVTFEDPDRPASEWPHKEIWQNATMTGRLINAIPKAVGKDITRGDRWTVEFQVFQSDMGAPAPLVPIVARPSIFPIPDFNVVLGVPIAYFVSIYHIEGRPYDVTMTGAPPGLAWDAMREAIAGTVPGATALQEWDVRFRVTDRVDGSFATRDFKITTVRTSRHYLSGSVGEIAPVARLTRPVVRRAVGGSVGTLAPVVRLSAPSAESEYRMGTISASLQGMLTRESFQRLIEANAPLDMGSVSAGVTMMLEADPD